MTNYLTDQESFWASQFGNDYIERNQSDFLLASNVNFFSRALQKIRPPRSCIEFGANVGMNIRALRLLYPSMDFQGIEINRTAAEELAQEIGADKVCNQSILDWDSNKQWELVLIKGVLIHINPDYLSAVYEKLVSVCSRYLLIAEYYNPTPIAVPYRGYSDRLFKRDFAGEIMDRYSGLRLCDYGFVYHRDPSFPQDDITWFLMENMG